jgi:hypothetical protein
MPCQEEPSSSAALEVSEGTLGLMRSAYPVQLVRNIPQHDGCADICSSLDALTLYFIMLIRRMPHKVIVGDTRGLVEESYKAALIVLAGRLALRRVVPRGTNPWSGWAGTPGPLRRC